MKHLYLNMVATRKQLAEYVNKTNISHNNLQAASAVVKILHSAHVKLNIPLMLHQSLTRVQVDPHLHHGTTKIPSIEERILDPEHHR